MMTKILIPALVAISSVAAQTSSTCPGPTTISSPADATAVANCDTVQGNVVIGTGAGQTVDLGKLRFITGDLSVENNPVLATLKGSSLASISGSFKLNNVTQLTSITFPAITKVKSIAWTSVPLLNSLVFTAGITSADSVVISDTYLSSLSGINVQSVQTMNLNNNPQLREFQSSLANVTTLLTLAANGPNLAVTLPNLIWCEEMSIANVTSFNVPSLATVNGSMRFGSNYFQSFSVPNLTKTEKGDISFIDNAKLQNMSFPSLTSTGGSIIVANNTALRDVDGFPVVQTIGGAIFVRGNFTDIKFPKLKRVQGAFDVSSTGDITAACKVIQDAKGATIDIAGKYSCTGGNANANSDTDPNSAGSGGSGGKNDSSAAGVYVNGALLGLAAAAGLSQALW